MRVIDKMDGPSAIRTAQSSAIGARAAAREFHAAVAQPDMALVLFFCSARYDLDELAEEVALLFAGVQVVGCTTAGEFGPAGCRDHSLSGVSFSAGSVVAASGRIDRLHEFETAQGRSLAQDLLRRLEGLEPAADADNTFALLLIDGLSIREEPVTRSLQNALGLIPMIGGSAGDGLDFGSAHVYCDGAFHSDSAVLLLATTPLPFTTFKTQHFSSTDQRVVVTGADPAHRLVTEIDGRPASESYARLVGASVSNLGPRHFAARPMVVMIDGTDYVRSIQRVNPDGSLTLFCAIEEGLVLRAARSGDLVEDLEHAFEGVRAAVGEIQVAIGCDPPQPDARAEIARLNKIIRVLMDRAERSTSADGSDFSQFQATIMLEEQVRSRTAQLQTALQENERINRTLRESEAKFRGVVSQSLVGIATIEEGRISYSNAKFDTIFGYSAEEVRRLGALDIVAEADRAFVADSLRMRMSGEVDHVVHVFRGQRKDGAEVDIESHGSAVELDGRRLLISVVMDITERTRAEREVGALQEQLRQQATRDALTGLHNRRYLEEWLGRELIRAARAGHPVSLIMSDLDHFKAVNDACGHLAGDEELRVFGDLMKRHARESDICCRYGGEEFLLVLPGMPEEKAIERAELLRRELATTPVDCDASRIAVTASFGVATFPRDGRTGDDLIAAADDAMYAAKAAGRNRVHVSPRA